MILVQSKTPGFLTVGVCFVQLGYTTCKFRKLDMLNAVGLKNWIGDVGCTGHWAVGVADSRTRLSWPIYTFWMVFLFSFISCPHLLEVILAVVGCLSLFLILSDVVIGLDPLHSCFPGLQSSLVFFRTKHLFRFFPSDCLGQSAWRDCAWSIFCSVEVWIDLNLQIKLWTS